MRRIIYKIALYLNFLLVLLLLLSYSSVFISPQRLWIFAFIGLAYPYILLANLVLILFWITFKKKEFLISFVIILLGWGYLKNYIQLNFNFLKKNEISQSYTREYRNQNNQIKILSFNVRAFNLYKWEQSPEIRDSIFRFIQDEDPDIICFQEFYAQDRGSFTTKHMYHLLKNTPHRHIEYTAGRNSNSHYGIATFSSFPIVRKGIFQFEGTINICIFTDIIAYGDTIRIYNSHLQSVYLNQKNYAFLDSLRLTYNNQQIQELKDISFRLRDAFVRRSQQVDMISSHISISPYPVIICGDFNDTPTSYTYETMRNDLEDSFVNAGSGIGNTYVGKFPSFRIDYILHSPAFESLYFQRVKVRLSDHYPIKSYLKIY